MTAWRFETHDSLPSTQDVCRRYADEGAAGKQVVLARHQTAGRGTRGRRWQGIGENLSFSFLLRPDGVPSPLLGAMPFLIAVAIHKAISPWLQDEAALQIKWPNDLLLGGGKVCGVLIEAGDMPLPWIVVGIGVNIVAAPDIPGRKTAAMAEFCSPCPARDALAREILAYVDEMLEQFDRDGFAAIRSAWLARAHAVGTPLAVQQGDQYITGWFSGLDGAGKLRLKTPGGEVLQIVAGDVLLTG